MHKERHMRHFPSLQDEIVSLAPPRRTGLRHGRHFAILLLLFSRAVALFWMGLAAIRWVEIMAASSGSFESLPASLQYWIVCFAVFDVIAATGLWLAAPWGGALWLLAVGAHVMAVLTVPGFALGGRLALIVLVALMIAYFVLNWYAKQERETQ